MTCITASDLRAFWRRGDEIALFDAREEGPFAASHPFFAVPLPAGELEQRLFALVPRRSAPVVFYDDGEGLADRAAARARALGYSDVRVLEGGLAAYAREGEVFCDVNVPSKAFGELVEAIRHTPSLSAPEVDELLKADPTVVVVDARRFEEYRTMSIPRGISVPGGELALRIRALAPDPKTRIVVNCAGRTRSIIGTQTLINAGIPNPVVALRNGTIGWTLAGQALDHGATRKAPDPDLQTIETARAAATHWATACGVRTIDPSTLDHFIAEAGRRTLYRFDIRQPDEHAAGHPEGFASAPGGQLVQATDEWVAVRGARIVLWDSDGVRAPMTASWLVQMGHDAVIVRGLAATETGLAAPDRPAPPAVETLSPGELAAAPERWSVLDLGRSPDYRAGHIPGAAFALRSRLAADLAGWTHRGDVVLTSPDGHAAAWAASEAATALGRKVRVLAGGTAAWVAAGLPMTAEAPLWLSPAIDVYKRPYEGTDNAAAAMQAYIDWELQLVAQLANDGISGFRVQRG